MAPKAMPPPCRPQLDDADLLEAANDDVDDFDLIEAVAEIADDDVDDDDRDEEAVDLIEAVRQNQSGLSPPPPQNHSCVFGATSYLGSCRAHPLESFFT